MTMTAKPSKVEVRLTDQATVDKAIVLWGTYVTRDERTTLKLIKQWRRGVMPLPMLAAKLLALQADGAVATLKASAEVKQDHSVVFRATSMGVLHYAHVSRDGSSAVAGMKY